MSKTKSRNSSPSLLSLLGGDDNKTIFGFNNSIVPSEVTLRLRGFTGEAKRERLNLISKSF